MKKVHKLKIDTQFPFQIIGISSHENDYRLIWAVNTGINTAFVRISNFEVSDGKQNNNEFSRYFYDDTDRCLGLYIISNRCDNGYLVPEYRNIDYFLFVKGECEPGYPSGLAVKLKKVEIISTAFVIDQKSIRSLKKILYLDA